MKKLLTIIPLVILLCFTFGCQKGEEAAEEVKAEQEEPKEVMDLAQIRQLIEEGHVKFSEAVRSGDATTLANFYTEDAMLLPPNFPMIKGREAVEAFWAGGFQMGIKEIVLTIVEVIGMGDMVCEIGESEVTIQPEGMDAIKDKGKYLAIFKKAVDGTWKVYVDIWNSSMPAQE